MTKHALTNEGIRNTREVFLPSSGNNYLKSPVNTDAIKFEVKNIPMRA